jgi:hypothetical protein
MDYNLMYKQSNGNLHGDPAMYPTWRAQAREAYLAGFQRAYTTNRAPLFIGNHFEQWNGGIYMDAVEDVIRTIAGQPDVRLVSFRQLVAWLEAQDPAVLAKLRTLDPGTAPPGGWPAFLAGAESRGRTFRALGLHPTTHTTKGGWPVSLTIGRPAASHSPMPPPTFTASKPFALSHAATRAERPPPRQVT